MKYFSPSYWFKLWVLSAPLFNDKTQGINAKSIDNKKIEDWARKNISSLESINQDMTFTNSSINYQSYNLTQSTNKNIDPFYQTYLDSLASEELETSIHKHRHEKRRHKESRNKRQPNPQRSKEIFQLNERLIINQNNSSQYINSFQSIVEQLTNNNILRRVINLQRLLPSIAVDRILYSLNSENYGYFRLPIEVRGEQNGQSFLRNLELVLRTDNLYIQGFIVPERGSHIGEISTYYHFDFTEIYEGRNYINRRQNQLSENQRRLLQMWRRQPAAVRDDSIPLLTQIDGMQNIQLTRISPDYRDMIPVENNNINWESIFDSFLRLTNYIDVQTELPLGNLARALGQVTFITAEALRFTNIFNIVCDDIIRQNNNVIVLFRNNQIYQVLVSWGRISRQYTNLFNSENQLSRSAEDLLIYSIVGLDNPELFFGSLIPIENITNSLENFNIRILLTRTIRPDNCNNREKRNVKNKFWHEKFCDLKPQSEKIQGKITAIKMLDENTKSENLSVGDIYVGTENGVYLIHGTSHQVDRFDNLNFPIKDLILDGNGSAYVINDKCEIYHLNLIGWGSKKTNMESCDLNKELKLYYNNDKSSKFVDYDWYNRNSYCNRVVANFNLENIDPIENYKKIDFFGDKSDIDKNRISWGDTPYFSKNKIYNFNELNTKSDNIVNTITPNNDYCEFESSIPDYNKLVLHPYTTEWWGEAFLDWTQVVGLTWNFQNKKYNLKVHTSQYGHTSGSTSGGTSFLSLGKGIRLYNDDTFETQIQNPNDRKKREIFDINNLEEKNVTKWTDEFTKSINNKQHLPPITNNTNYITNNITNL